ncbi:helix-turn-helix transcriptional regulator [Lactobacillus amylovorus subsp. amylovorus]|uniref:helix-turn-helix domain-containing protein n=1 Tax=Lactobacillus amylovorus TaxID=1604 RepID=UPI002846B53A|nr:helix-turn-helix transcriptional regulator [Lactobacillus amylovorus]
MQIGEALRTERIKLGLTQNEMSSDIVSRSFYAKVEAGKNKIAADRLFRILFLHNIDISEFNDLIQKTYNSDENNLRSDLEEKMAEAFSNKDVDSLTEYCQKIIASTSDNILKLRALVTVAYFKGDLKSIDDATKQKLKEEFDEGNNWTVRPDLLRLFANTMPLWAQDELDFWVGRLLSSVRKTKFSSLMLERYLRIFENYLVTCYDRKIRNNTHGNHVEEIIKYIIANTDTYYLMIYRINALYMRALFTNQYQEAEEIKKDMKKYGYEKMINNWPH